ncbi:MAG TPA: TonB-dependent receptor [Opitutaceae bacterium]|nr:TonB-dependent receptor [Opitutaceae bacterium]
MRNLRIAVLLVFTTALLLPALLINEAAAQGITTSSLNGKVTRRDGSPITGATVTILHRESNTRTTTSTRANGQYNASGLRPGGPYSITVAAPGYPDKTEDDVFLSLDRDSTVDFSVGEEPEEVVKLEKFVISELSGTTFGVGKMSTGSSFTTQEVINTPTVRRNVQDVAQLDSRVVVTSLDQGGNLSAQGQHFRFNSFLIDGVQANDPYGLNGNGFSSLRSPVPMEAIQAINVDLNPFDVRRSGFLGALVNAVIKSGTNQFHGSITYERTNQDLRAESPLNGVKDVFNERTFNFAFGGPIIKDKLFFFVDYEDFKRTTAPPAAIFKPDATALASIVKRASDLGYDAGDLAASNSSNQKTLIAKVDWNVSDSQRLTVTYRRNHGEDANFADFSSSATSTSLSNYWFQQPRNTDSITGQLFSTWTPNLRTEATISYSKYDGTPQNHGDPFPKVTVSGVPGIRVDTGASVNGSVNFGTENSRQYNFINTKDLTGGLSAEYSWRDHTFNLGGDFDQTKIQNDFVQNIYGVYTFSSPDNWIAGTPPSAYQLSVPAPGRELSEAFAHWNYTGIGLYLQDTYKPNTQLTLSGGLRLDYPYITDRPPIAPGFEQAFGIRNDNTASGNYVISPRVGFIYELPTKRRSQFRGGVGLFQGKSPAVYLSNAYANTGAISNLVASPSQLPSIVFSPDVNAQPTPTASTPTPNVNVTDPDFVQPAIWKSNLAFDHELSWGGLVVTAEFDYISVEKGIQYEFLNYKLASSGSQTMPDGRDRYDGVITPTGTFVSGGTLTSFPSATVAGRRRVSSFADVIRIQNTGKGDANNETIELQRPMKNHWAWSVSYTRTHATEVTPITSSTALSNYQNRASFNPNEEVASLSNTNIRDRIVATLTREFNFFSNAKTTVSLIYQGRTGHPYSWVFRGDANGDGLTFNDLLYVPTGPEDPKVRFASDAERDDFFAFVNATDLRFYKGSHPSRNSETSPWTQTIDLRVVQELPIYRNVKTELYVSLLNLGNLIKKSWGLQEEVPFSYRRAVAGATYDAAANGGQGQWVYTFNPNTLDGVPVTVNDTSVSRWQVQAGVRLKF